MEAVKQGSAVVGAVSSSHVVLAALKRSPSSLSAYQKKIIGIDRHIGIAIAGLTSDARVLSKFMRSQSLAMRINMDREIPVERLVTLISNKAQKSTQYYGGRPFGVGLLVAGYDETGPHLLEFSPSGAYYEYSAMAIGARSQAAKTYLESHFEEFKNLNVDDLIHQALCALRDSLPLDSSLTIENTSVAVVGVDRDFTILEGEEISHFIERLNLTTSERRNEEMPPPATTEPTTGQPPAEMQVD